MDANTENKTRARVSEERRWSMSSQRIGEIVSELMRPISDLNHSFDTDHLSLLEEYLTEAGIKALAAAELDEDDLPLAQGICTPNFAELALLLQQTAAIYGRKVDFLYNHVLSISDSLQHSQETNSVSQLDETMEEQTPSARKKRKQSVHEGFSHITIEPSAAANKEPDITRPPPTLPRYYIELEPRPLTDGDTPLYDYDGEPIGLLTDFYVTRRLHDGQLVDDLEEVGASESDAFQPVPLAELQASLETRLPEDLPPLTFSDPPSPLQPPGSPIPSLHPEYASTPLLRPNEDEVQMPPPIQAVILKKDRKRKLDLSTPTATDEFTCNVKLLITEDIMKWLSIVREFSIPRPWIKSVVTKRKRLLLENRRSIQETNSAFSDDEFTGFDLTDTVGGFTGWSVAEVSETSITAAALASRLSLRDDSEDDGFFERSSLGDSATSRTDETPVNQNNNSLLSTFDIGAEGELSAWQAGVVARAAAAEARSLDVRQLASQLFSELPQDGTPRLFTKVLRNAAQDSADVSRLFLTSLFLANGGNVEIVQGAPLSLNTCSLKLVSTDERLYNAAASADEHLFR